MAQQATFEEQEFGDVVVTFKDGDPACIFEPDDSNETDWGLALAWLHAHHPGVTMRATEEPDGVLWMLDRGNDG